MNCKNCIHWVFGRCTVSNFIVGPGQLCNAWELSQSHEMVTMPFATFDDKELQERIAELEAAQRWIPVSERMPEEDTDGNTLMAICRHSGEWVRAPFGAEFADEFVRHYSYWMYAPQPPEVQE